LPNIASEISPKKR